MASFEIIFWIIVSIISSTGLILLLKMATKPLPHSFIFTLTTIHIVTTWFSLKILNWMGLINEENSVTSSKKWTLASFAIASIAFMNFNLRANSVGFYQMSKLVNIPYMLCFNFFFKNKTYSLQVILSLSLLLIGVGLFSVYDVEVNFTGTILAIIAVISTAHNQMMSGELQGEFLVSGAQLQMSIAPREILIGGLLGLAYEVLWTRSLLLNEYTLKNILPLIGTCLFAVGVNVSFFFTVGKTSSITFQVVSHFKTVLLLVLGFFFFPTQWESNEKMWRAYSGIGIALIGVFWYSAIKGEPQKSVPAPNYDKNGEDKAPLLNEKA